MAAEKAEHQTALDKKRGQIINAAIFYSRMVRMTKGEERTVRFYEEHEADLRDWLGSEAVERTTELLVNYAGSLSADTDLDCVLCLDRVYQAAVGLEAEFELRVGHKQDRTALQEETALVS